MKHKNPIFPQRKIIFLISLILFSGLISSQPVTATDFTIYPEDNVTAEAATLFKDIDPTTEKFYGAYYFGTGSNILKDARSGLAFSPTNRCLTVLKKDDVAGNEIDVPGSDYSVDSAVDKTNDYHTKNLNYNLLTSLLKSTATLATDNGLICDFDVTGDILNSQNTLKIYMYIANKGTGAKLLYCSTPADLAVAKVNHCQYLTNFPNTNEVPGITINEGGFDLNLIEIKKGSLANTVSIKLNSGAEQTDKYVSNGKVYLRILPSATETFPGPFIATIARTAGNANINTVAGFTQTCNGDHSKCIEGSFCTGASDTCTGVCNPSCLKCTGSSNNNCSVCSPLSSRAHLGLNGSSCDGLDALPLNKLNGDISIALKAKSYSRAGTISFWAFIENSATALGDKLFTITFTKRLMVAIGKGTGITAYCVSNLAYYQNIPNLTSSPDKSLAGILTKSEMDTQKADPDKNIKEKAFAADDKDKTWFHVKCSFSIEAKKQYVALHSKDAVTDLVSTPETITVHNYVRTFQSDFSFRFFDNPQLVIKPNSIGTMILIKNLAVFGDYVPNDVRYEYFILEKSNTYPFTSLLFYSKLSSITMSSNTNGSFDYISCEVGETSCQSSSQSFTFTNNSFWVPKGYMKLNLLAINTFFDKPNLLTTANLTCTAPRKTCYKTDLAITCANNNYVLADKSCAATCDANTNPTYIVGMTGSQNSGFCSSTCGTSNTCVYDFNNYNTNFTCQANFTKLYLFCYANADELKGAIHFSQYFNSPNFSYTVSPALTDYHFEIWFYPDRRFIPNSIDTNLLVLLTSAVTIKKAALTTENDYQLYDSAGNTLGSTFTLKFLNWYRLAFSVKPNGSNFDWSFYYNKYTASYLTQSTSTSLSLSSISFCTTCTPNTNKWFSGFYRWMRIWKGDFITTATFKEMDKIFTYSDIFKMQRFNSNSVFLPMHLKYLEDNKIKDLNFSTNSISITITPSSGDFHQYLNFSGNFDQTTGNNYISAVTFDNDKGDITVSSTACPVNCSKCNSLECLACDANYYLEDGTCKNTTGAAYYFLSPAYDSTTKDPADLSLASQAVTTKATVSFFIKFYANSSTNSSIDIFRYSINLKIRLVYSGSTVNLELYSNTGTIGTFQNFHNRFGKWTHISLAYYYNSVIVSYFPAMLNFQVNFQGVTTDYQYYSGNLGIQPLNMVIPKEPVALYGKIWVWDLYHTGSWAFMSFATNTAPLSKIIDAQSSSTCLTVTGLTVNCYMDYDPFLYSTNYCANRSHYDGSTCIAAQATCPYGFYTPLGNSIYCSCDNKVKDMWINKSDTRHYCTKLDYVNLLKFVPITLSSLTSATTEYTLEFWIYINLYVPSAFEKLVIEWEKHLKIEVSYSSGLKSKCYPVFYAANPTLSGLNSSSVDFTANGTPWGYIRCSVDLAQRLYFSFDENLVTTEKDLTGAISTSIASGATSLVFKSGNDDAKLTNQGAVFIRQFRLWKCYLCQDADTYRLDVTNLTAPKYTNLLYLFEAPYTDPDKITDIKANQDYTLTENTNWIGYNVFDMSSYKRLTTTLANNGNAYLCNEFKDVCSGLLKLNQVQNQTFSGIQPPMNNRFTIELWALNTNTANLNAGIHFIWRNVGSVSLVRDVKTTSTLNAYCWPQDHRLDLQSTTTDASVNGLTSNTLNYDVIQTTNANNQWVWIRCSVNFTNRQFYLSDNAVKTMQGDLVYGKVNNDVPLRYLWQNNEQSSFIIAGGYLNPNSDIMVRSIYLFNDFIPKGYLFKYNDISKVDSSKMPHFAMTVNFGTYYKQLNKMGHFIGSTWSYKKPAVVSGITLNYISNNVLAITTECNVTLNLKYNSSTQLCELITSCDTAALNAKYCSNESTAIICADNFHYDPVRKTCVSSCSYGFYRGPGSSILSSICNVDCDANSYKCNNMATTELIALNKNFSCLPGYDRVGYNCIEKAKALKSNIYFNGCLNYPNMIMTFPSGNGSVLGRGYTLEFWMKIDRLNEFCKPSAPKLKYYFIGDPHVIYNDPQDSSVTERINNSNLGYNLYYQLLTLPTVKVRLTNISQFNWNHVSIHVDLVNRNLRVYTNFNYWEPEVKLDQVHPSIDLNFNRVVFCSTSDCIRNSSNYLTNIAWGAAFYKFIRVSDGINYNPWDSLEYYSSTFDDNLNTQFYDYPLNLNKSIDNNLSNMRGVFNSFDFYTYYPTGTLVHIDKDYNFNFGSTFDFAANNPNQFINGQEYTSTTFTAGGCQSNCRRCVDNSPKKCVECVENAKLFGANCKRFSGYYLKMPILNYTNKFLSLNVNDIVSKYYFEKENEFTLTIWIKYHGQLLTNKDECIVLFRFTTDGRRYICYHTQNLSLYFYEGGSILYEDKSFTYNIGQWTLLSISSFINQMRLLPDLGDYFGYLYRFYVNNQEIVKKENIDIPAPGWTLNTIEIGYGFSAVIADINIYKNFIVNPWGYVTGPRKSISIIYSISLDGKTADGECLPDPKLKLENYQDIKQEKVAFSKILGIQCKGDYSPYLSGSSCSSNTFFDTVNFGKADTPCSNCNSVCVGNCANASNLGCTCDFVSADHALRIDPTTKKLYCEYLPYTDFTKLDKMTIPNIKMAKEKEYSIEFWFYLYTYNNSLNTFNGHEIIWDYHNRVRIYNLNNSLFTGCTPIIDYSKADSYSASEKSETVNNPLFTWIYVTCSVNVNQGTFYGTRLTNYGIETSTSLYPDFSSRSSTDLIIQADKNSRANYGFLFLKDIKLWSLYNIKRFDTICYRPSGLFYYDELLHYFRNERYTNSITDEITNIMGSGTIRPDFIGYNVLTLRKREEMIQKPFKICSVINIYPITGVINVTKFTIQSRENEYLTSNAYKFYYYFKGISTYPITISSDYGNRDVNVIFEYPNMPENINEVTVEVFVDIIPADGDKYTLFKQLKLYRTLELIGNYNYTNILQTLTINNEMSNEMILDAQKSLSKLETDLPLALNSTFSKSKFAINPNGTISFSQAECTDADYCNNRGTCFVVNFIPFCKCNSGYKGRFCQITESNQKVLFDYSKNLSQIAYYNLYNNTNFSIPNSLSSEILQKIYLEANSNLKFVEGIEDMDFYVQTFNLLLENKDKGNVLSKLNQNKDYLLDISSKLLGFLQTSIYKTKYDNLNEKIKSSNSYQDASGKYYVRFLNTTSTATNTNTTNSNTTSSNRRRLTKKFNKERSLQYLFTKDDLTRSSLNNTNGTNTTIEEDPYVIIINDPKILDLTEDQIKIYREKYNRLTSLLNNFTKAFIQANQIVPIRLNQANEMFNYTLDYFNTPDFSQFDFSYYFGDRIQRNQSYFDAKNCILENLEKINKDGKNIFYISYYFYDLPIYTIFSNLMNNTVSLTDSINIYDYQGNKVDIQCKTEITHYLSIFPYQQDFFKKYLTYTQKYESSDPINSLKKFMPYYIFPNGCIDHKNKLNQQIDMYYRQYDVNVTVYDPDLSFTNVKAINSTVTGDSTSVYTSYFKSIQNKNYIVAGSKTTGEFAAFVYFNPLTGAMGNNYYLEHNQIFSCGDNYKNNMCFILIMVLAGINVFILIGFIALKTCFRRYEDIKDWSKEEDRLMRRDNLIFGENRYTFNEFDDKNFYVSQIYSNKFNISKNKVIELNNEENPANKNNYNSNEIFVPFEKDLSDKSKKKSSIRDSKEDNKIEGEIILPGKRNSNSDREDRNVVDFEADDLRDKNKIVMNENKRKKNSQKNLDFNIQELKDAKEQKIGPDNQSEKFDKISLYNPSPNNKKSSRFYSLFHFIVFRNIYTSLLILTSPFSPKYKTYSKFVFLVYLEMLSVILLFIFGPFDFINIPSSEIDKRLLTSYVFYSVLFSNTIFIVTSLLYKVNDSKVNMLKSKEFQGQEKTYITWTNILKTVIINSLNIGLLGGLFYISFGFCAVWTTYAPTILILWAFVLVGDFVVMEITLEFLIVFFYCFRNLHACFAAIMRFLIALKNLRNYH